MRGRVSLIKVYASDSMAVTWALDYSAYFILLAFSMSCGGEFYPSRFTHSILWTQCGGESYWVSHIWSCTYRYAANISSGKILRRERLIQTVFIPTPAEPIVLPTPQSLSFLPWVSHARESKIQQNPRLYDIALPHFSYKVLGVLPRLVQGPNAISCRGTIDILLAIYLQRCITVLPLFRSSSSSFA